MLGGTFLITLSLFMLSLCHPQQFYAVSRSLSSDTIFFFSRKIGQAFLCHGLGLGLGSGLTYVPSISLISHYFTRRRTLAFGISSAGSSLGALFYPILLNHLFHGSVGFHNGVRITATLNFCLLATATVLMKPRRPPTKRASILPKIQKFIRDPAYMTAVASFVFSVHTVMGSVQTEVQSVLPIVGNLLPNILLPTVCRKAWYSPSVRISLSKSDAFLHGNDDC